MSRPSASEGANNGTDRGRAGFRGIVRDTSRSRSRDRAETPGTRTTPARARPFAIPFDPYPETPLLRPVLVPASWEKDPTERRSTPLHNACREIRSSVYARRQLLSSPPDHIFVKDNDFHTPLYYALHHGLNHAVCMLMIESWRSWETKHGPDWAQAHRDVGLVGAACSTKCNVDTLREVLIGTDAYPNPSGAAMERDYGHRPLEILWANFLNELQNRVLLARATKKGKKLLENDGVKMLLQKTSLILEALEHMHTTNLSSDTSTVRPFIPSRVEYNERIAHLSVEYCTLLDRNRRVLVPYDFLYLIFRVFPEQLLQYDDKQRMPLHVALCMEGSIVNHIVPDLLRVCPRAASALDGNLRTPMSLAIESGRPWKDGGIVDRLLSAAPDALSTRDTKTHLFPFMLAASRKEGAAKKNESYSDITTIFKLLRASPDQVQGGCV